MDSKKTCRKLAKELDTIRYQKVQRIRDRIKNGRYQIKNAELAKALLPYG